MSKSPPGMAKAVAILSTPVTKLTRITYNSINTLPITPVQELILLNILPFNITIYIIRFAILGMKNPRNIPGLP